MKHSLFTSISGRAFVARPLSHGCFAALLAGLISVSVLVVPGRAQPRNDDEQGGQVLTRGPVHEAFAGVVSFYPAPGIVVRIAPPELIEEIPPEERPEGDDVAWIPGYWGWDDERNDYLWISGTWRTLPPGREWMAGYWRDTGQGHQWISGYWADAEEQETTYLPPPPVTLEIGANIAAPSDDYGWTPGCWEWQRDRYAWRAGYWAQGRSDWVWIPSYYVWTPRGVIFVEGFWDYPVERRGILFAPVYYQSRGYDRRGYSYSPRIVISLSFFNDNLFLRPAYHHYYFGDYYDSRYEQGGFYASFSFQTSRSGYDPFYAHNRWEHRSDRDWENRYQVSYQYRRENEIARPPRTWSAQLTLNLRPAPTGQVRIVMAVPLAQLATSRDNPVRFQAVASGDRQKLAQRGREVQQSRDQRRTVEAKAVVASGRNDARAVEPVKVSAPRSPIVAKPVAQRARNQAPPEKPQTPRPEAKEQPKADSRDRPPSADRRNPSETRQPEAARNAPADRRATDKAREDAQREAQESQKQAQQDADKRARDAANKSSAAEKAQQQNADRANAAVVKSQQDAQQREQLAQKQADDRSKASAMKAQEESQRKTQQEQQRAKESADKTQRDEERGNAAAAKARDDSQRKAQQDDEKRANAREESQQRANESEAKAKQQADDRGKAAAEKAQEESPRRAPAPQAEKKDDERRAKEAPAKAEPAAKGKPADKDKPAKEEDEDDDAKKEKEKRRGG